MARLDVKGLSSLWMWRGTSPAPPPTDVSSRPEVSQQEKHSRCCPTMRNKYPLDCHISEIIRIGRDTPTNRGGLLACMVSPLPVITVMRSLTELKNIITILFLLTAINEIQNWIKRGNYEVKRKLVPWKWNRLLRTYRKIFYIGRYWAPF